MPRTVTEGFQIFLSRLEPLDSEWQKAVSHKYSVKRCLENYLACYRLDETGSFGNGTGIKHFSDIDYFACFPVKALTNNSTYFLQRVRDELKQTFTKTEIKVNSPAVTLYFGKYASENIEVTPCNFKGISQKHGKAEYEMPDGSGGWMLSSPQARNAYVDGIDSRLQYKLKPLIKFVKAWKYMNNVPLISFYLELRIAKLFESSIILHYDEALLDIFYHLADIQLANMRDPLGISGLIPAAKTDAQWKDSASKLVTALSRISNAVEARKKEKTDLAFDYLNKLFGGNFPAR